MARCLKPPEFSADIYIVKRSGGLDVAARGDSLPLPNRITAAALALIFPVGILLAGEPALRGRKPVPGSIAAKWIHRMRTKVTKFDFEEDIALAPRSAPIPKQWERYVEYTRDLKTAGRSGDPASSEVMTTRPMDDTAEYYYYRFPDYLRVDVMDLDAKTFRAKRDEVHGGRRAIRMQLAGTTDMDMVGIRRRVPLDVNPSFAYELSGFVRLVGVKKSDTYARLWIEWLDKDGKRIGEPHRSDKVDLRYLTSLVKEKKLGSVDGWVSTPEFRLNEVDPRARSARVWCVAAGREMGAYAYFDDLVIRRRPKVSALPAQKPPYGIFAVDETPALSLHFQGLELGTEGQVVIGYRRLVKFRDIFGRQGDASTRAREPLTRKFTRQEVRGNTIKEKVDLEGLNMPGVYAVEIELQVEQRDGSYRTVARRVTRIAKMGSVRRGESSVDGELCAVDLDLYHPDAKRLVGAAQRGGIYTLAFPLWRPDSDANKFRTGTEVASPEEDLEKYMRDLVAARMGLIGSLSPVPKAIKGGFRDWSGARTLYKAESDRWSPLVEATAKYFQSFLMEWRMAAVDDVSFGGAEQDRPVLAAKLRAKFPSAPSKRVTVPVQLENLTSPAPRIKGNDYRETIFVPARITPAELDARLRKLFPRPKPKKPVTGTPRGQTPSPVVGADPGADLGIGAGTAQATPATSAANGEKTELTAGVEERAVPAAGRRWFLELITVSENLGTDMTAEKGQVNDMARKFTMLTMRGAERIHVELANRKKGLLGPGFYPRPVYSAYSVLAEHLTGARYLGEFDLTAGAQAYAFERDNQGLIVFWTDETERNAPCQLGASGKARLVELTGASRKLKASIGKKVGNRLTGAELVPLRKIPALLTGLEPAFIRTRLGFRLADSSRLETRYQSQEVSFEIRNFFKEPMQALVHPSFPRGSHTVPRFREVNVEPGKVSKVSFMVRPSFVETVGRKKMSVVLTLSSGTRQTVVFTLSRTISVESPIGLIHTRTVRQDGKTAEIQLQIQLSDDARYAFDEKREHGLDPNKDYDFDVYLVVPGGSRQRAQVRGIKPGQSKRMNSSFVVPLGDKPRKIYAGARQHGGVWFTNMEIELPAAKK